MWRGGSLTPDCTEGRARPMPGLRLRPPGLHPRPRLHSTPGRHQGRLRLQSGPGLHTGNGSEVGRAENLQHLWDIWLFLLPPCFCLNKPKRAALVFD